MDKINGYSIDPNSDVSVNVIDATEVKQNGKQVYSEDNPPPCLLSKAIFNMTGSVPEEGFNRTINEEYENITNQDIFVIAQFSRISEGTGGISYRARKYGEGFANPILNKKATDVFDEVEFSIVVPPGGIYEFSCSDDQYRVDLWNETRQVVGHPPAIKTQPIDITIPVGQECTLSCELADNGGVISWEWWEVDIDDNDISSSPIEGIIGQGTDASTTFLNFNEGTRYIECRASNTADRYMSSGNLNKPTIIVSDRVTVIAVPMQDASGLDGTVVNITSQHTSNGNGYYGYARDYPYIGSISPTTVSGLAISAINTTNDSAGALGFLKIRTDYFTDKEFLFIYNDKIMLRVADVNSLQQMSLSDVADEYTYFAQALKDAEANGIPLEVEVIVNDTVAALSVTADH